MLSSLKFLKIGKTMTLTIRYTSRNFGDDDFLDPDKDTKLPTGKTNIIKPRTSTKRREFEESKYKHEHK